MPKRKTFRPTDAELEILTVLWSRGPSTVREVHKVIARDRGTSQTTTLKLMQIMHEKGTVTRDESQRPQVYSPALPEDQMQKRLVSDLLERAFGGSARKLLTALAATGISEEELAQIRQVLDGLEEEGQ